MCVVLLAAFCILSVCFSPQTVCSRYSVEAQKTLNLLQKKKSNITVYYWIQKAIDL